MSKPSFDRFDRLLSAMLAGPAPSAVKREDQSQRAKKRNSAEKPETPND
jgi:hypothetical protein